MSLSADDIRQAFRALAKEFEDRGARAELIVVGGAALVMLYRSDQIWAVVSKFVPAHLPDKASYAFENPWESVYGSR